MDKASIERLRKSLDKFRSRTTGSGGSSIEMGNVGNPTRPHVHKQYSGDFPSEGDLRLLKEMGISWGD